MSLVRMGPITLMKALEYAEELQPAFESAGWRWVLQGKRRLVPTEKEIFDTIMQLNSVDGFAVTGGLTVINGELFVDPKLCPPGRTVERVAP